MYSITFITIALIVLGNLAALFAVERFMGVFFETRKTYRKTLILSYGIAFVALNLERLFSISVAINLHFLIGFLVQIILAFTVLFVITLNYRGSMAKKLGAVSTTSMFFILTLWILAETIVAAFFDFNYAMTATFPNFEIILYLASGVFCGLLGWGLRSFNKIRANYEEPSKIWIAIVLTQMLMIFFISLVMARWQFLGFIFMITILAILFATNLFILLLYNSFAKLHEEKINVSLQAREKEYYLTQSNLMQESMERVKSLRHDMKNHLAVLRDYSAKDRSEEAIKYVDALLEEFGDSDIYSDTGNIAFDSVINYKLRNAKKDNIALDLQISLPTTFNMDDVDIVTIFGNLLDNALEAVSKVDEKTLKIDIELSKGAIYAKIENSFNGEVKYSKSGVDEDRQILSSKSKDRQGYGIANTTKALAKYNGYMKFSHTDSLFSVGVFLYLENK